MNILFDLFLTFAKIGLFTFGGGYAMISTIENNCVERKQWITHDEMMNVTVIAESTPGPIAINCATFTGYKKAGFSGALVATLGMIVPSFVVIYLISVFLDNFLELTIMAHAFKGIKIAVGILILDAAITMIKKMHWKRPSLGRDGYAERFLWSPASKGTGSCSLTSAPDPSEARRLLLLYREAQCEAWLHC